jgi:hypothetical protein
LLRRAIAITRDVGHCTNAAAIERAFIRRLFDALGYATNRAPMQQVAVEVLEHRDALASMPFDRVATWVFARAGASSRSLREHGRAFMSEARLAAVVPAIPPPQPRTWHRSGRPGNAPERRLWAAAGLLVEILQHRKIERVLGQIRSGASWVSLQTEFIVRFGGETFVGADRASEITLNVVLPTALAAGVLDESAALIEGACRMYRSAPTLPSNQIVRSVERRHLGRRAIVGGFWQQGAIEYHQRVLSPDRSRLDFIAEQSSQYLRRAA